MLRTITVTNVKNEKLMSPIAEMFENNSIRTTAETTVAISDCFHIAIISEPITIINTNKQLTTAEVIPIVTSATIPGLSKCSSLFAAISIKRAIIIPVTKLLSKIA